MYCIRAAQTTLLLLCLFNPHWKAVSAISAFSSCEIGETTKIEAQCLTVRVAEDPAEANGQNAAKIIDLFVARLPAYSRKPRKDPLTLIAGGPGQSATETYPSIAPAFEKIREHRDIVLIDQRGTGQSNKLSCPQSHDDNNPFEFDPDLLAARTKECLASLSGDPRFYTTSVAITDLEAVRRKLNIEQWNIYGISYGTRVALHYLKQYPKPTRSLILDAVVPPQVSIGANLALDAQRALELMLKRCDASSSCHEQFPDLHSTTENLLASLKISPRNIVFENFNSGELEELQFTYHHMTLTLRMLSYTEHGIALLPFLINDAYKRDNFAPLARQSYLQAKKLEKTLATGMHNAVICTEDQPFADPDKSLRKRLRKTFLGTTPLEALDISCADWPKGVLDKNFHAPVESDRPVLILSGEADPITPPQYGKEVASRLSNSLHIVNAGQGHMQAHLGCIPTLMQQFIEYIDPATLNLDCLERLKPYPFFVNANGPNP